MKISVSRRPGVLLGVFLLAVSFPIAGAQVTTSPQAPELEFPEEVRELLDEDYEGWTVKDGAGCDGAAAAAPLVLTADFDNDLLPDYAAVITAPDGSTRVLAILARVKEPAIHELGPWTEGTRLQVLPAGRRFRPADSQLDDYFSAQTLGVGACGGATTAYLWTGKEFRATVLR